MKRLASIVGVRAVIAAALAVAPPNAVAFAAPAQQGQQSPSTERQKEENEKSVPATHYTRTLGPFAVDGQEFTAKLNVNCYKSSPHPGQCNEDDEEAAKSLKIVDARGKTRFSESFPIGFMHQLERHSVRVTLLEGSERQALEIVDAKLPSPPNTGVTVQILGIRNGTLKAMNDDPLEFYGMLGELPPGQVKDSKALLPGDTFPIYVLTSYFYVVSPVRLNWKDFELDQRDSGDLDVVHQPPYGRKPDIESNGFVELYASPDTKAASTGVDVTPQSKIEVRKARFREGPPNEHDKPSDTWLEVSIDGKVGWLVGLDAYTAIGLTPIQ